MGNAIGVGIIGVQVGRGWAAGAHIPALRVLDDFRLVALSTRRQDSADAAARHFGVPHAFADHEALVRAPDVELVVVTVKVPHHLELASAAIRAGKAVFCEWPLGNGLAEAEQLQALAQQHGVKAVVGLQGRLSPEFGHVRDLLAEGAIGRVLSATVTGSGPWGPRLDLANAYTADVRNGANLLTIPVMHTIDTLQSLLGPITELRGHIGHRRNSITVAETGETLPMTSPDEVVVLARTRESGMLTLHYQGSNSPGPNFHCAIHGEQGEIRLVGPTGFAEIIRPQIWISRDGAPFAEVGVPATRYHTPITEGPALNVAEFYRQLAGDLRDGTRNCPDFSHGVACHRIVDAIERSSAEARWIAP